MLHSKSLHACHHGPRRSAWRQRKLVTAAAAAPIPAPDPHTHRTLSIDPINKRIFIFGLGYTSVALANWLSAEGWHVSGTCRSPERAEALRARGWAVGCFDPARGQKLTPELQEALACSPYLLSSVPPLALALYDPALAAQKALVRPLAAEGRVAWFGYLSSTGVYGDWQGEWVDESSPCRQTSSKGIVRQEAEAAWMGLHEQHGLPVHVFRLGGIYGPGRSILDTLQAQSAQLSSSQQRRGRQRYTARCHVYDICAVLVASMTKPSPGRTYNVVDDDPAPRGEVAEYARQLLGSVRPGTQGPGDSIGGAVGSAVAEVAEPAAGVVGAMAVTGGSSSSGGRVGSEDRGVSKGKEDNGDEGSGPGVGGGGPKGRRSEGAGVLEEKRVRNGRIKEELGVVLRYPTYREGVEAIARGEAWPLGPQDLQVL